VYQQHTATAHKVNASSKDELHKTNPHTLQQPKSNISWEISAIVGEKLGELTPVWVH
jgi:hypothetical protein